MPGLGHVGVPLPADPTYMRDQPVGDDSSQTPTSRELAPSQRTVKPRSLQPGTGRAECGPPQILANLS